MRIAVIFLPALTGIALAAVQAPGPSQRKADRGQPDRPLTGAKPRPIREVVRVRRNYGKLDPAKPDDKKIIDQYRDGVRILKERSKKNRNDKTGWEVARVGFEG